MSKTPLNPQQRLAVEYTEGPLLVIAGAGSGKTRVITEKISHLIDACHMLPQRIAAITFTNKAAKEMRERVGRRLDPRRTRGLTISTFHALGLSMLRLDAAKLGYRAGFSIFDSSDSAKVVRELLPQDSKPELSDRVRQQISRWKNATLAPDAALTQTGSEIEQRAATVYARYAETLKRYNAFDFDDLIMLPLQLFEHSPEALARWQERIRYLLVDEYQDTNVCQYLLLKTLAGERGALTAVGDDDQSIYGWRGARAQNIEILRQDFPDLKVITLEQNYRSTGNILKLANHVIQNNDHLFEKRLWSDLGDGEPARIVACANDEEEALRVTSEIMHRQFAHDANPGDFAVLYRSNHQSRVLERALRAQGIAYHVSGGTGFFERAEVKDALAYLRLICNPDDNSAFLRVVNTPRRGIGRSSVEKIAALAEKLDSSLFGACFADEIDTVLGSRAGRKVAEFVRWLVECGDQAERGETIATVEQVFDQSGYRQWIRDEADTPANADRRLANLDDLLDWLRRLAANSDAGLADLLTSLALMTGLDKDQEPDNQVRLMTLHAAKGLEFRWVFLVGLEEGLLPHRNSLDDGAEAEERRLFYVGLTRAQRGLWLSYSRQRKRFGELRRCEPSRFLKELPRSGVIREGADPVADAADQQQRAQAHMENLRELFG